MFLPEENSKKGNKKENEIKCGEEMYGLLEEEGYICEGMYDEKQDLVLIEDRYEAQMVYFNGFYGKSPYTRSEPVYEDLVNMASRKEISLQNFESRVNKNGRSVSGAMLRKLYAIRNNAEKICRLEKSNKYEQEELKKKKEVLMLLPEEAYYLITKKRLKVMNEKVFLSNFSETKRYKVYEFFREQKWVVRDGFQYGCDYLLYKDGMPFSHASHLVYIEPKLTSAFISNNIRIASQNVKKCLIVNVNKVDNKTRFELVALSRMKLS